MKNLFFLASLITTINGIAQDSQQNLSDIQITARSHQIGAKSPAGYPKIKDPAGLRFEVGGMYQNAILGGTAYAYLSQTENPDLYCDHDAQVLRPRAKMSWGVNGAVSYYSQQHEYELKLRNSYYDLSTSSSIESSDGSYVYPYSYSSACSGPLYSKLANSKLDVTYDLLGLELQKSFFVNRYFSIDVVGGLLASWTWFTWTTQFQELNFEDAGADPEWFLYRQDHSSWFGIGPELGFNLNFNLARGFSLFFANTGALMYGKYDIKNYHDVFYEEDIDTDIHYGSAKDSIHSIMPYVQSFMGLAYEFFSAKDRDFIKIRAGYNTQFFFSANQMLRRNQELQTQGLQFDLAWSF